MTLRSFAAALLVLGSAVPYTGPVLCTAFGSDHMQMASCPIPSGPVPDAARHGCDLAGCATVSMATPVIPHGISLAFATVEPPRVFTDDGFDGDARPPLTPPPIA